MMLAGRAADMVLGGGADAGASSDIEIANTLLRAAMIGGRPVRMRVRVAFDDALRGDTGHVR